MSDAERSAELTKKLLSQAGGRNLDARIHFYYYATVNTPALEMKLIGKGSQYASAFLDSKGKPLDPATLSRGRHGIG